MTKKINAEHDNGEELKEGATQASSQRSRRRFLGQVGGITATTMAASAIGLEPLLGSKKSVARAQDSGDGALGPLNARERELRAAEIRNNATQFNLNLDTVFHANNGDDARFANRIGSFTKSLKHNARGEVDPDAYEALLRALRSARHADFEAIATGGHFGTPDRARQRRLVNPQSAYAFELEGIDSLKGFEPPAPAFSSAEEAGEMVELYWMSLLRDVNFRDFDTNPVARAAAADLSNLSDFRGPKIGGRVTTQTLFRDVFPGCLDGPYLSQFMVQPVNFGSQTIDMRIRTVAPNVNFMTTFQSWLDVQNGIQPTQTLTPAGSVLCRNGRDLGQYVHIDALYQAYFCSCLNLLGNGYLWDPGNPYGPTPDGGAGGPLPPGVEGSLSQTAFGTFGGPGILALMTEVSSRALKAQWCQKWLVHRRLRPEEFGGRVEVVRRRLANYPIHQDLFRATVLDAIFDRTGNHLLPMAFPEGSPVHPAYGSGHATVAGACVTILKWFFNGDETIKNPVQVSSDGRTLEPFVGPPLTVNGELNKIASNVATGRNIAGVHWRTDAVEAIRLGER
jgi:hypothetical protein